MNQDTMDGDTLDNPRFLLCVVETELSVRKQNLADAKVWHAMQAASRAEDSDAILADYEEDVRNGEALVEFTENLLATYDMYVTHAASDLAAKGASYLGRDI